VSQEKVVLASSPPVFYVSIHSDVLTQGST